VGSVEQIRRLKGRSPEELDREGLHCRCRNCNAERQALLYFCRKFGWTGMATSLNGMETLGSGTISKRRA
jgi:hypothetical protein